MLSRNRGTKLKPLVKNKMSLKEVPGGENTPGGWCCGKQGLKSNLQDSKISGPRPGQDELDL